jgi:hypothetical protein
MVFPGFRLGELLHLDHRDLPIWLREAERQTALKEQRTARAAFFPHGNEEYRTNYMDRLQAQVEDRPTPHDQEAAWAKNHASLAAFLGRKKS